MEFCKSSYVKSNFDFVSYTECFLGKKLIRKRKEYGQIISEKDECFVYIPILDSLRKMLNNKRIASQSLKEPSLCRSGPWFYLQR